MKKFFLQNKTGIILVFYVFSYFSSLSQAKLVVSGAKINMVNTVFLSTNDISLSGGSTVTVDSATIKIAGTMSSSGSFDLTNGTVETNGTTGQIIPPNVFLKNVVRNLTVNNNAGVIMQGGLALTDVLTLGTGSLASSGYLTLKSTYPRTARVAPVTSLATLPISGDVIVERFIPAKRAYRFLTAPLNSSTGIRGNWMENTNNTSTSVNNNPAPGFGTHITGPVTKGFDATLTQNPSMYTYDALSQKWISIQNTSGQFIAGNGYRIMVRGSRSTDLNNNYAAPSVTTLRAKGSLLTGTLVMAKQGGGGSPGMPELCAVTNGYSLIGNPYASVLDWNKLEKIDIENTVYAFDPTINGSGGRGQYVTFNGTFQTSSNGSNIDNNLQSGQAFFVRTTGPNPTITFRETHKASANRNVFRTSGTLPKLSIQLQLPSQVNTTEAADGVVVFFSTDYSSNVSEEDSYKLTNQDENMGVLVQGKVLSIAGRQPVNALDTVALEVWQLTKPDYYFRISLQNFDPAIQTFLHDSYLKTNTPVINDIETVIPFSINADTASLSKHRFEVVFRNSATLPVELSAVKAYQKDKGIQVEWTSLTENYIDRYVIEKSFNGQQFEAADSLSAKQNSGISSNYAWYDATPFNGKSYYRIKAIDKSGVVKYSRIVKVQLIIPGNGILITNNPVPGSLINFEIRNLTKGKYTVTLVNSAGQILNKTIVNYNGGVTREVIKLNNPVPAGMYQLHFAGVNEEQSIPVLFE